MNGSSANHEQARDECDRLHVADLHGLVMSSVSLLVELDVPEMQHCRQHVPDPVTQTIHYVITQEEMRME